MCQVTSVDQYMTAANEAAPPSAVDDTNPLAKLLERSDGLRVLICSESVPPQVNGIARRVGMYADGLRNLGCDVGERNMLNAHRGNFTCQSLYSMFLSTVLSTRCPASRLWSHESALPREPMELHCAHDDCSSLSIDQTPHNSL